jgi:ketosteroid isomerase-like protein
MLLTDQVAVAFVEHHVEVWNKHDLEDILQLYTEDVELVSPFAGKVVGSDVVRGREGLREYFGTALARNPDLRFEVVDVLRCVDSVTIYMRSVGGRMVAEVLFVNDEGLISRVLAHYTCSTS